MTLDSQRLHQLFKHKMGLDPDIVTTEGWQRVIKERMTICEIHDFNLYLQKLFSSSIEFQEFVELLVVPETWFFRDKAAIEFVVDYARKWMQYPQAHPIRILSLPCSSGEEPYSIAMMFLDEYFPTNLVHIDGVDISKKALAKAEIGEYTKNSFRSKDLKFRDQFFFETEGNFILNPAVRQLVHFSYGNLLDPNFAETKLPYDIIFCRNLFIYLHVESQKRGISTLKTLLNPEGILVVSPAEAELVRSYGWNSYGSIKACSFTQPPQKKLVIENHLKSKKNAELEEVSIEKMDNETHTFEKARQLADLGKLTEALNICHECLKSCNTDPHVYFLIGLIEHAQGHEKISEEYFLKTVYLDPEYYEALVYLALIAENQGEIAQAELFRSRAKRIDKPSS